MWITLMACQDPDHVVRVKTHHLRRKANLTDEEVMDALKVLSEPDQRTSIPQEHEGRRIRKVEDGWLLLNGAYYLKLMQDINRKARLARAQATFRAKKKGDYAPLTHNPEQLEDETDDEFAKRLDQYNLDKLESRAAKRSEPLIEP